MVYCSCRANLHRYLKILIFKDKQKMCVIAACYKRPMTKDEFENCFTSNSHGAGFAWKQDGLVRMEKGFMDLDKAWAYYSEFVATKMPHVAHFRIRTAGDVCKQLTHPFIVNDTSPLNLSYAGKNPVLFHNGVFFNWEQLIPYLETKMGRKLKGLMSDSRFLALGLYYDTPAFVKHLRGNGAFAIVKHDKISIIGDQFIKEDGIYFSNTSYKRYRYTSTYTGSGVYDDDDEYYKWWKDKNKEMVDETKSSKNSELADYYKNYAQRRTGKVIPI